MRAIHSVPFEVDRQLEAAVRAKQQLDTERWRAELRPHALQMFAARAARIRWTRALVTLVVEELFPDDLFDELVGSLHRVPPRQWPRVLAIAVALRHSWRRDGLSRIARKLGISLAITKRRKGSRRSRSQPSRRGLSGSPRRGQGSPLRSDPAKRGSRP